MNLFKISTLTLALALTGWVACSSSNDNPDVPSIGTGGAIATGGAVGTGGVVITGGVVGTGGAGGLGGAVADAGNPDAPSSSGLPDAGMDGPAMDTASADAPVAIFDAASGETGPVTDICVGLTPAQCHLALINALVDTTVSALDPGSNPPVPYPTCAAQ